MASIVDRVWEYKTFSELTPEAAERAIKDDRLFSTEESWGKSMDPNLIDSLFYSDGRLTNLTVTQRMQHFPVAVSFV